MKYTNQRRVLEITAVILTGLGKFIVADILELKFYYIIVTAMSWFAYIIYRISKDTRLPAYWGFGKEGFRESLKWILPASAIALLFFLIYGITSEKMIVNWHLILVLILYPLWGTVQQFLIIALLVRNLSDMERVSIPKVFIVLVTSVVFSVVHFPLILLTIATFILAIFYTMLYLKYRNLWMLGIFHGWLGAFFYYFVLGKDSWLEFTKALQ